MIKNDYELQPLSGERTFLLPVLIDLKFIRVPEPHEIDPPNVIFTLPS
jgi:hypothetical protein